MAKKGKKTITGTVPSQLGRRTTNALERLKKLTARYQADGLSEAEARKRSLEDMRDNGRGDWRTG